MDTGHREVERPDKQVQWLGKTSIGAVSRASGAQDALCIDRQRSMHLDL